MRLSSQFIFALLLAIGSAAVSNVTAQDLFVGDTTANNTTNFTSGTNSYANSYVGYTADASNNLLTVGNTGTLLTNAGNLYVGYDGSINSLVISNGAQVVNSDCFIGNNASSSHNSVLVSDAGTLWSNGLSIGNDGNLSIGNDGSFNSLVISNGAQTFVGAFATIGNNAASSNNSVVVTSNALWTTYYDLYIGHAGSSNSLEVSGGGTVTVLGDPWPGHYNGSVIGSASNSSNNSMVVSGIGSTLNSPNLYVGDFGSSNSLVISNGAQVVNINGWIGNQSSSSNNSVVVSDSGTIWTNQAAVIVGHDGSSNSLVISNGAQVIAATDALIGNNDGSSNNTVVVTGSGSVLNTLGNLYVGHGGSSNSLVISGGGQVFNASGVVGTYGGASNNTVLVTGIGSLWSNSGTLDIGASYVGGASVALDQGGSVTASNIFIRPGASLSGNGTITTTDPIGLNVFGGGTLSPTGTNSLVINGNLNFNSQYPYIDYRKPATLLWNLYGNTNGPAGSTNFSAPIILNGSLNVGWATFELNMGSNVSPSDSFWTNDATWTVINGTNPLTPGTYFNMALSGNTNGFAIGAKFWEYSTNVNSFYLVASGNSLQLLYSVGDFWTSGTNYWTNGGNWSRGLQPSVTTQPIIDNGGTAILENAGQALNLYVGFTNAGSTLLITNGGQLSVTNLAYIGYGENSSNNSVMVTGPSSLLTGSGSYMAVGYLGSGNSLVISDGAKVLGGSPDQYFSSYIGYTSNSSGNSVLVTGANSLWANSGEISVGRGGGSNRLTVADGGTVTSAVGYIGNGGSGNSSNNSVLVTGANSLWTNSGDLWVGVSESGNRLTVADGGTVAAANVNVGSFGGSGNSLVISNGGTVASGYGYIGLYSSNNSVLVSGTNSSLAFTNGFFVGYGGDGNSLTISNGASVTVVCTSDSDYFSLGEADASSGNTLTVIGASTLSVNVAINSVYGIWIGDTANSSNNAMVVSGGGKVYSGGESGIGYNSGALSNSALITGAGSLWTNNGVLVVGGSSGQGSLTVANGGTVAATTITVATNAESTGVLNIGRYGTNDAAGIIDTPTIAFGSGTGTINFNQTDSVTISAAISDSGNGVINQLGSGTTILGGNNSGFSGTTLVSAGTLKAASTNAFGTSAVTLTNSGTLALSTNLTISSLIWSGGSSSIAISNLTSGAYLNITGALTLTGSGTGTFDLSGNTLGANALQLMAWGTSNSYTTDHFSVTGLSGYRLSISNNALWIATIPIGDLYVGSNSMVPATNFTSGTNTYSNTYVGYTADASNNLLTIGSPGTVLTNRSALFVGYSGASNTMIASNGSSVFSSNATIGVSASSGNNTVIVGGVGSSSLWSNANTLNVGYEGAFNTLEILSNGVVQSAATWIGGESTAVGNSVLLNGGLLANSSSLVVGYGGGSNSLVISNGTAVNGQGYIGYTNSAAANRVLVTGSNSLWKNTGTLSIGYYTGDNSLIVSNGGKVTVTGADALLGYGTVSSNNSLTVTGAGSSFSNNATLLVGNAGGGNSLQVLDGGLLSTSNSRIGGTNASSRSNSVTISGSGSLWTNRGTIQVGSVGSDNSLLIADGGIVRNTGDFWMGYSNSASNNNVLVDGAGSQLAVGGGVVVGRYGGANTLTIANGGTLSSVEGIELGASNGATGALNIGRLGSNDTAGTLNVLGLRFGAGGGAVNFNQQNAFAVTNLLAGNGSLNQLGAGTTILTANTSLFSGAATVTRGTLSLPVGLTVSSLLWDSSATIALPGAGSSNYLTVSGAASLTGSGTNTFDLTGVTLGATPIQLFSFGTNGFTANQFGITGISDYLLSVSSNSLWISVNSLIAVTSNTIVTNSATYPSVTFQTNGIITITQSADLTITSPVDATNNGTVVINGTLNAPALIIPIGGTLMGSGTYTGGNLTVNGTFAPGNSPGTFYVSGGNLIMGSTSVWDQQIYSASIYDRVEVTGSAILNGVMNITTFGNGGLQFGQKYIFLTASGGISGAFSSIVAPEGFRGRLLVSGTQANILIAPTNYTQLAANRNQSNVATALNSFIPYTSGDQLVVSTSLDSLTASQYTQAFNAIMPTFYQQIATIAFNNANAQNMQLVQRLWGLRVAEGGGFSMSGLADNMPLLEGQGDGKGVLDSKKDILRPGLDNHWGMFVDGNGIFAQANSGNMLPGYNSQSGGVTTGLTYKWNENVGTGIYCGYQGTYTKSGADGSGLGTGSSLMDNAVRFGVFGTYGHKDGKGLFVNTLAGGGYHNFQATRVIQYAGMKRTANSAPGAGELDTMLAAGYDIKKDKFTFGPTASLQYTYLGVNSLNETGAQSLSFNSGGWNSSSMLSSVGAHAAYSWVASKNILVVPQVNLSWQHEFMQNPYAISGNLGGTSPTFSNWSATPIRDFLYTGVGFTVELNKKWNTSFFYNAAAGNSDLVSQNIFWSAGVKF